MQDSITVKKKFLYFGLSIIVCYLLCLFLYNYIDNKLIFPHPNDSLAYCGYLLMQVDTYQKIFNTLSRLFICILLGFGVGVILAFISYTFQSFKYFIQPFMVVVRSIPLASIIVIILITIGYQQAPFIVTLLVLIPIFYTQILIGLETIDDEMNMVWKLDSKKNFNVLFNVHLPLVFSSIKAALVTAIGLGFKVLIMAEYISQTKDSIGQSLVQGQAILEFKIVYAWTIIMIILVLIMEVLLDKIKNSL